MSSRALRPLCLILVLVLPATLISAETRAAIVFASGMAVLNGTALPRSTSIFSGDRLETSNDSAVTILADGSAVLVGPNSRLLFQGDAIELKKGSTQISTSKGMKTQTDTLIVEPSQDTAKYQVTRGATRVMVASLSGSVTVTNGKSIEVLAPGESETFSDDTEKKQKKDRDRAGAAAISDRTLFLWASAALAAGGFLAWWFLRDDRKPLSNQLP